MDYQKFAEEHHLKIEIEDRIAIVRMNRPDKRNAVNLKMHRGLEEIWHPLGTDPDVGAIVLTGEGKGFCAGGDLVDFYPKDPTPFDMIRPSRRLVMEMVNCEAPVVAAVQGVAAGLGATLALLCDIIYAADDARIGDTHVGMGMVAGDGGAVIWPLLVGPHRAKEMLMGSELVPGPRAAEMGLVNHCVPAAELMDRAIAHAKKLAAAPPIALRWTKQVLNQHVRQSLNLVMDSGIAIELLSCNTDDFREAGKAFFEKRKPVFRGR